MAELFAKLFATLGLAVRDKHVYKRVPGTLYSWIKYMPLEDWVGQWFHFGAPPGLFTDVKRGYTLDNKTGCTSEKSNTFPDFS